MAFTQSCFIRKNTPELRKKLEELGYDYYTPNGIKSDNIVASLGFIFDICSIDTIKQAFNNCIDCGTNEELFLALAALRDDTDYMQWFICDDNESMFKVDKSDMSISKFIPEYMDGWDVSGARKATVEEIIEHFKDRYYGRFRNF